MSVALIIILISRRVNIALSLGVGAFLYGILSLGRDVIGATLRAFNTTMLEVVSALVLAMFLAELFNSMGISARMVRGLGFFGEKFAAISAPAVVGLLPMPGGAYVSAVMTKPLYDEMRLSPHEETFVNYWFRHIWVTSWPLFQGVILAAGILGTSTQNIIRVTWPVTVISVFTGLLIALPRLRRVEGFRGDGSELIHLWPFFLIGFLSVALGINIAVSVAITILVFILVYRPRREHYVRAAKYALNITIVLLIILSLVFSEYIRENSLSSLLAETLKPLGNLILYLVPFVIGFATGAEFTYIALGLPPLIPLLSGHGLVFAFTGGYMGVMLSPAHSCLILSVQHYKADLRKTYELVIPAVVATTAITFLLFSFLVK